MDRLTEIYHHRRRSNPVMTPLAGALLLGGAFGLIQVALPRADSVLSPLQVTCFAAGGYLITRDAIDAAELEAHRRGDLTGRLIGGAVMGFFWFLVVLVGQNNSEAFLVNLIAIAVGAVIFGGALVISSRSAGRFPMEALAEEFVAPDASPSIWTQMGAVLIPFVGVGLALRSALPDGPTAMTYLVLFVFGGLIALHQPKNWRLIPRMIGVGLVVLALLL